MFSVLYNGTGSPVPIDVEGRSLGAGEWGVADRTDPVAKSAADLESVTWVDVPADTTGPAGEARDLATNLQARNDEVSKLDVDTLRGLVGGSSVSLADEHDSKPFLVRALTRSDVTIPAPTRKQSAAAAAAAAGTNANANTAVAAADTTPKES